MNPLVKWSIRNTPAMNTLMGATLLIGFFGMLNLRREVFPEFELEIVLVSVPYPGASPEEVEEGICQKIEEAVRSIAGIKKVTSVAGEGAGSVVIELERSVDDVQKVLGKIRSEVDRIPSFPVLAEDPEVQQITMRQPAIRVGIIGPDDDSAVAEWELRSVAEGVRDDLIRLGTVSQANILAAKNYQVDIQIPEEKLREYGLTLRQIADIVRRENLELPGGTIKNAGQDVLVKGKSKFTDGPGISGLPVITRPDGVVLTVGDLGTVSDGFDDSSARTWINNKPAMVISVDRTAKEDLLEITEAVHDYVKTAQLPAGYSVQVFGDMSLDVRDRMELLARNGLQGLALVFIVLAVFLEIRLAIWVALGVPLSILGACAVLLATGETLNMLSMFGFLMALGILVDDAIVIGENIHEHRQRGKSPWRAAIDGTAEVMPSVVASVCTTIIAFLPLMFVSGVMGKFIAVLPVAVIAMLLISLFESIFILPCHLAHTKDASPDSIFSKISNKSQSLVDRVVQKFYLPTLGVAIRNPAASICVAVGMMILAVGVVRAGWAPFIVFPKLDTKTIIARVTYPDGTPAPVTLETLKKLDNAAKAVDAEIARELGEGVIQLTQRTVGAANRQQANGQTEQQLGGNLGEVKLEISAPEDREISSEEFIRRWREKADAFSGVESLTFGGEAMGPGGKPIEFKLLVGGEAVDQLEAAVEDAKAKLAEYDGVSDISDDSKPGKWEFQLRVKPDARSLGVPLQEVAQTVRGSYYGEEVMRLQRGRHEVKLMVRYPREDRRSLADFEGIRVRMEDGAERPLTEVADVVVERGYSEINRVDQNRSITVTSDLDTTKNNASEIVKDLKATLVPALKEKYPDVYVRWEGQQEQTQESLSSMAIGYGVAMLCMFVLLTLEFQSYLQPLLIMAIIPFGIIGAIGGHVVMNLPVTMFSIFGIVALTGVVVNDSIVLIDFINHRVRDGMPLHDALLEAGHRRFRPVMLTSLTTVAGLFPMLMERSFQAQILIPMATSLCFGLMLATFLVLYLIPVFYGIYYNAVDWAPFGDMVPVDHAAAEHEAKATPQLQKEGTGEAAVT